MRIAKGRGSIRGGEANQTMASITTECRPPLLENGTQIVGESVTRDQKML